MASSPYITDVFRIGPEKYLRVDAGHRLRLYIIVASVIAIALAIAGISDLRYLFLCFIFVMVAYVTALFMLWASMGTDRRTMAVRHTPQQWTFTQEGFEISFPDTDMAPVAVGYSKVTKAVNTGKYIRLTLAADALGTKTQQTLFIPSPLVPAETITLLLDL